MFPNDEQQDKTGQPNKVSVDSLGAKLQGIFQDWKSARQQKEDEWLEALQAFHSEYSQEEEARLNQNGEHKSKVYIGLTRMKVVAAYARIVDLLFQPGQTLGEIQPTPIPDTEKMAGAQLKAKLEIEQLMKSGMLDPAMEVEELMWQRVEELRNEASEDAHKRADAMNETIDDQMVECDAGRKIKMALAEMVILGDGCIKGVTVNIKGERKWVRGDDGRYTLKYNDKVYPDLQFRSVFNIYPDPYATGMDDMTGIFDRHIMTKQDIYKLRDVDGFDASVIDTILMQSPSGNHVEEDHESRRREMGGINATSSSGQGRFEVLEYWGQVAGQDLKSANVEVEDESKDYQANIWMCNGRVIKAMLNPLMPNKIPYMITPYEFNVHSFWGTGLPKMMRDSQAVINVSARVTLDNMAISSGPIAEVNTDLLPPGANINDIKPWSVHARSGGDPSHPLLRFYQHPNLSGPAMQLIDMFRQFADEETSMPSYSHGQTSQDMTKTASGMSMLMGAANVSLKSVIKNIDDYLIEPMYTSFYDWNMRWNPDDSIKGDAIASSRGSSALMAREVRSEKLMQFMQMTANPVHGQFIKNLDLLREVASSMDLNPDDFLMDEEEFEARQQAMQADMAAQQQQGMGGADGSGAPEQAGQAGAPVNPNGPGGNSPMPG